MLTYVLLVSDATYVMLVSDATYVMLDNDAYMIFYRHAYVLPINAAT